MKFSILKKFINIEAPILITGPSGTGKSHLAQKIFSHSEIHKEKFLTLHLASIKDNLLESELFGHRKGSFTGAIENKNGYFKEVGTGTLFLDEVGELSLESQKKLLYILEEKKYTPIGSTVALNFEGRLIMATNKNLKEMVAEGKFREDLYFRLTIFQLELQEISKNKENLERQIHNYFSAFKTKYNRPHLQLNGTVLGLLMAAPWKGNYRELKNCIEFTVAMSEKNYVEREDLPHWFFDENTKSSASGELDFIAHFPVDFNLALECFESWYLKAMFIKFNGRVNETSRILGISKTTLINKAKKYQIDTLTIRAQANHSKVLKLAA